MDMLTPNEAGAHRHRSAKLHVAYRETRPASAEIIYLGRASGAETARLPMAERGSGSYHEDAIRAEQPTYRH